jgi:hypothetical protein
MAPVLGTEHAPLRAAGTFWLSRQPCTTPETALAVRHWLAIRRDWKIGQP